MNRDEFIEIAALIYTKPKEFERILKEMTPEEYLEYDRQRHLWIEEQELAKKEGRLH